jgi:hypothetical protein
MKQRKYRVMSTLLSGFLILAVGFATGTVCSANQNLRILIDGKDIACDPAPFIKEGRVYIPLRAVSEALGQPVKWDAKTRSVLIGTTPEGFDLVSELKPYQHEDFRLIKPVKICGVGYSNGYWIPGKGPIWNLGGKFNNLTFAAGRGDESLGGQNDAIILVIADGKTIARIDQPANTGPVDYTIDISGVKVLSFGNLFSGSIRDVPNNAVILNPRVQ